MMMTMTMMLLSVWPTSTTAATTTDIQILDAYIVPNPVRRNKVLELRVCMSCRSCMSWMYLIYHTYICIHTGQGEGI